MKMPDFTSERWDVNKIVNDTTETDARRLFALILLWKGRANDIEDRSLNLSNIQKAQVDTYRQTALDLERVLRRLYPDEIL